MSRTCRDQRLVNKICARHDRQGLVIAIQLLFSNLPYHASAKRRSVEIALLPALDTDLQVHGNAVNITAPCC